MRKITRSTRLSRSAAAVNGDSDPATVPVPGTGETLSYEQGEAVCALLWASQQRHRWRLGSVLLAVVVIALAPMIPSADAAASASSAACSAVFQCVMGRFGLAVALILLSEAVGATLLARASMRVRRLGINAEVVKSMARHPLGKRQRQQRFYALAAVVRREQEMRSFRLRQQANTRRRALRRIESLVRRHGERIALQLSLLRVYRAGTRILGCGACLGVAIEGVAELHPLMMSVSTGLAGIIGAWLFFTMQ